MIASSIERLATEIRHLQRTEVLEAEEYFSPGQKGSSAMPHKRNPVLSENLVGLARMVRAYALPALENVALWHERDISHSSVERMIAPDATVTLDFSLARLASVVDKLLVYPRCHAEESRPAGRADPLAACPARPDRSGIVARGGLRRRAAKRHEESGTRALISLRNCCRTTMCAPRFQRRGSAKCSTSATTPSTLTRFFSGFSARLKALSSSISSLRQNCASLRESGDDSALSSCS